MFPPPKLGSQLPGPKSGPAVVIFGLPRDDAKEVVKGWLKEKRTTLWQSWIVTDDRGLENAAEFVLDTLFEVIPLLREEGLGRYERSLERPL